jgi:hypothetical protein
MSNRSIVVYYTSDGQSYLSDSAMPEAMNESETDLSDANIEKSMAMAGRIKEIGGGLFFFRTLGTGFVLVKSGGEKMRPEYLREAVGIVKAYLYPTNPKGV